MKILGVCYNYKKLYLDISGILLIMIITKYFAEIVTVLVFWRFRAAVNS